MTTTTRRTFAALAAAGALTLALVEGTWSK